MNTTVLNRAFEALFILHTLTSFQLLVIVACVAFVAALAGLIWGSRARDDFDELYAGRSLADDARAGRVERRQQPRAHVEPSQPWPKPPSARTPRYHP